MKVPLTSLSRAQAPIRDELLAAAVRVIDDQEFILGKPVARFEASFAALCSMPYAVGVASGTDELILALRALGIGPGHGVITTPFTFVATSWAISDAPAIAWREIVTKGSSSRTYPFPTRLI